MVVPTVIKNYGGVSTALRISAPPCVPAVYLSFAIRTEKELTANVFSSWELAGMTIAGAHDVTLITLLCVRDHCGRGSRRIS